MAIMFVTDAMSLVADGLERIGTRSAGLAGTQTLTRGLDVINVVADGLVSLNEIALRLGLTRSTAHRLAATLVDQRYLDFTRNQGYRLGPKLLELGSLASRQLSLPRLARSHLEKLAMTSGDTVHLAVRESDSALYLDKIPGRRRVEISSRIGERQPLRSTGIGKALVLDDTETMWNEIYRVEERQGIRYDVELPLWLERMRIYAQSGFAFDLEENEDRIRCVAAPIRDANGVIAAAISISSAAQYMDEERMHELVEEVKLAANAVSEELGWSGVYKVAAGKLIPTVVK